MIFSHAMRHIAPLFKLGINVQENSELDLFAAFNAHKDDARIPAVVADMEKELGEGNCMPVLCPNWRSTR